MTPSPHLFTAGVAFLTLTLYALTPMTQGRRLALPRGQFGFVYKPDSANGVQSRVTLSFYIGINCPATKRAFSTILRVADYFGPENVRVESHLFSLPYHRHSHTIAKGAHVIDEYSGGELTYAWFQTMFDYLHKLTTKATVDLSDRQVMDIYLAPLARRLSGIAEDEFKSRVQEREVDRKARLSWKYGCTRGVFGTPTFMLNDVVVQDARANWTDNQWIDVITPLLYI